MQLPPNGATQYDSHPASQYPRDGNQVPSAYQGPSETSRKRFPKNKQSPYWDYASQGVKILTNMGTIAGSGYIANEGWQTISQLTAGSGGSSIVSGFAMSAFSAVGISLAARVMEYVLTYGINYCSDEYAADDHANKIKLLSCVITAGVAAVTGLAPSFAAALVITVTAKVIEVVATEFLFPIAKHFFEGENLLNLVVYTVLSIPQGIMHAAVGYGGAYGLIAAANALKDSYLIGSFATKLIVAVSTLNPLGVAGACAIFTAVDILAKNVLRLTLAEIDLHDQELQPTMVLARVAVSVIATGAIATALGLTSSIVAAGTALTLSMYALNKLTDIASTYSTHRDIKVNDMARTIQIR